MSFGNNPNRCEHGADLVLGCELCEPPLAEGADATPAAAPPPPPQTDERIQIGPLDV